MMKAISRMKPAALAQLDNKVKIVWKSKASKNLYILEFLSADEHDIELQSDEYMRDFEVKALIHEPEDASHAPGDFTETAQFLKVDQLKAGGRSGAGVPVAVLDTGIESAHPAFSGTVVVSKNFSSDSTTEDLHGHGTWCASATVGRAVLALSLPEGMAPGVTQVINAKMLNANGSGSFSGAMMALEWAAGQGAKVLSNSWGGSPTNPGDVPPITEQFFEDLKALYNCIFVFAAGNSGPNPGTVGSPGELEAVITVGAIDHYDQIPPPMAGFSSRGPAFDGRIEPDISAPGVSILGAWKGATTRVISGTSMATPQIAGMIALFVEPDQTLTDAQIREKLSNTSIDILAPGKDNDSGWGYPDALAADSFIPGSPMKYLPSDSPIVTVNVVEPALATTLSLATDKVEYETGENIALSGELLSPSEAIGVPGRTILVFEDGIEFGQFLTEADGSYALVRSAPAAPGLVNYQSKFLGDP